MESLYFFFPARREWPQAIDDVGAADRNAESIRLVSGAVGFASLHAFGNLKALWCFDIGGDALAEVCECESLESLHIENLKTDDFRPLKRLANLKVLSIDTCAKATTLDHLLPPKSILSLALINFKNVHDLAPLSRLVSLRSLAVAGSTWTRMRVASFKPLEKLSSLELLHVTNIKAQDESLEPLAGLRNLRRLDIANFYPMREFARLSSSLRSTECNWFRPYFPFGHGSCKKCGGRDMLMLTGKGKPMLCQQCDQNRLTKHVRDWNEIAAAVQQATTVD